MDGAHPLIKSGEVEEVPAKIFKRRFAEPLEDFLKASPQSLILIEPSIRDVLSDHPVYPQCELDNVPFNDPVCCTAFHNRLQLISALLRG